MALKQDFMNKIYFDNSATTALAAEVIEVFIDSFKTTFANPSSVHGLGKSAKKKIEEIFDMCWRDQTNVNNFKKHEWTKEMCKKNKQLKKTK